MVGMRGSEQLPEGCCSVAKEILTLHHWYNGIARASSAVVKPDLISAAAMCQRKLPLRPMTCSYLVFCCLCVEHGEKHVLIPITLCTIGGQNLAQTGRGCLSPHV